MGYTKNYNVTDPWTLREVCINNSLFHSGTNRQYDKMFLMNSSDEFTLKDVALCIWICSTEVTLEEVTAILEKEKKKFDESRAAHEKELKELVDEAIDDVR